MLSVTDSKAHYFYYSIEMVIIVWSFFQCILSAENGSHHKPKFYASIIISQMLTKMSFIVEHVLPTSHHEVKSQIQCLAWSVSSNNSIWKFQVTDHHEHHQES